MAELLAHDFDEHRPWRASAFLAPASSISVAAALFIEHLKSSGVPTNTVAAFHADLRLFCGALGADLPVASLSSKHVRRFYTYLQEDHPASCSSRSLRRRATAIQAFLRYLLAEGVVGEVETVHPELKARKAQPEPLLGDDEIVRLSAAAHELAAEGELRALLLVSLLLSTGMAKSECLALQVTDFDLDANVVTVGAGVRRRTLPLVAEARQAVLSYLEHGVKDRGPLFGCTGRNLEYILARVGARAGLTRNPSFRLLRATAAARMYATNANTDNVVRVLGISPYTWPALRRRVATEPPSGQSAEA
ncbi:MAG: tyrosine-type recombinase/integrase [Anaerolineae bacterium]